MKPAYKARGKHGSRGSKLGSRGSKLPSHGEYAGTKGATVGNAGIDDTTGVGCASKAHG